MPRLRVLRAAIAVAVTLACLAAVASAGAAGWQGPATLSAANVNAGGSPVIALGRAGDAAAAWWDDTSGGRIALARKPAGAAWSAPITVASPVGATPLFPAVDGSGNVTLAYTSGGATTVATMAPGAAAPTLTPLPVNLTLGDLAVDAAGDAVLVGWSGSPAQLTVGYRSGASGAFALKTYAYPSVIPNGVQAARAAINAAGTAVVVLHAGGLLAVTRTAATDWPAAPESLEGTLAVTDDLAVGIDAAGNALAAFTYTVASPAATILRTARRPAGGGGWQQSPDLSPATAGSHATLPSVPVAPAGAAALVWLQAQGAAANVEARYGTSGSGVWGAAEDVNDTGASTPAAAIADDGTVVAAWERTATGGNVGQARVRAAGPSGAWGDIRGLGAAHTNGTTPSLAGDGAGDFATVSAPYDGTYHPVVASSYDAAGPALTAPSVTGQLFAGNKVTMGVNASDAWSSVGTPAWAFGDGTTASGAIVTHTFASAGSFTVHVAVTDGSGNTTAADVTIAVPAAQVGLANARFVATWKRSRVHGTLRVTGSAPIAGSYVFDVSKGKTRRIHIALKLAAGTFARDLKLPATLAPGTYRVAVVPAAPIVKGTARGAKLAAPVEGVADVVKLGRVRGAVSARFHFSALPRAGALTLAWYRTAGGMRTRVAVAAKTRGVTIAGSLPLLGRRGTFTAVLARAGKVIAQRLLTVA